MRNMVLLAAGVSLLAGCAMKKMKSTPFYEGGEVAYVGEASDRVNLWPVAYWRIHRSHRGLLAPLHRGELKTRPSQKDLTV